MGWSRAFFLLVLICVCFVVVSVDLEAYFFLVKFTFIEFGSFVRLSLVFSVPVLILPQFSLGIFSCLNSWVAAKVG